jgi:hypothetical protein
MITTSLAQAIERASERSAEEQDLIATLIIDELEAEKKWDELLAGSKDKIGLMAKRAIAEHRAGKTIPLPNISK